MTAMPHPGAYSAPRRLTYWSATVIVIGECIAGGIADLARLAPFYPVMIHLGYPSYFTDILGTAKLLAAAALLVPGLSRLKEWAYAGIMFNMIGAAVSHLAVRDGVGDAVVPVAFGLTAFLSWRLSPGRSRVDGLR